jgi:hypothetical protein
MVSSFVLGISKKWLPRAQALEEAVVEIFFVCSENPEFTGNALEDQ